MGELQGGSAVRAIRPSARYAAPPQDPPRRKPGLASRIGAAEPSERATSATEWREAGPGVSYSVLSMDRERQRASLLFRLAPVAELPI